MSSSTSPHNLSPTRKDSFPAILPASAASASNSRSSSASSGIKKRRRGEDQLIDISDAGETTVIPYVPPSQKQDPRTTTPPTTQEYRADKSPKRSRSQSPGSRIGDRNSGDRHDDTAPLSPVSGEHSSGHRLEVLPQAVKSNEEEEEEAAEEEPVDDLLMPLPEYGWEEFVNRFHDVLEDIETEEEALLRETEMWNWMYKIWASSRSRDDTHRLSQEMATIVQWAKLKEQELERARVSHTESMLAISTVLGIAPKGTTPPQKNKKRR
ncbi:hypothetical protein RUND412_008049 [Rhizina undulata]